MSTERFLRFTISLPRDLYVWGEQEREKLAINRSEFITAMYRQRRDEQILRERCERYKAAYAARPLTDEERAWIDAGSTALDVSVDGQ